MGADEGFSAAIPKPVEEGATGDVKLNDDATNVGADAGTEEIRGSSASIAGATIGTGSPAIPLKR